MTLDTAALLGVAAALTVAVETTVLALRGHRSKDFLLAAVLVNLATNLPLNTILFSAPEARVPLLIVLEPTVVAVEWWVLTRFDPAPRGRLAFDIFLANLLSFACGFVL